MYLQDINQPSTSGGADESLSTPKKRKLLRKLSITQDTIKKQNKKIKRLTEQNRRRVQKIHTLLTIIECLKKNTLVSDEQAESLKTLNVTTKELNSRQLKNAAGTISTSKYSPVLRSFALTLYYYSSKAYSYVRKVFNLCLPHPHTIQKWYKVINGCPGFTKESLEALKLIAKNEKEKAAILLSFNG